MLPVEYQLNRLTFQNGEKLNFPASTRMRYGDQHHAVWIEMPRDVRKRIVGELEAHHDPSRKFQELRRIDYAMLIDVNGRRRSFGFKHFLKPGCGVGLGRFDDGDLYFEETNRRQIFTKDYTLDDVTKGEVPTNFKVWQFHGYMHEH